jgi:fructose-specific phosphotransferase system component IIB
LTRYYVRFLALAGCLLMSSLALAQQSAQPAGAGNQVTTQQAIDTDIQLMRQDIRSERKKIIAANLPLTETEATKFWPVYDRYIAETIKINDGRYALIKEYAQNYQTMTDDQADSFIKRWLGFDQDNTQLRMRFIPEFEKVISHKKTAMFFQMDRRLGMMIELKLASQVPLVQP